LLKLPSALDRTFTFHSDQVPGVSLSGFYPPEAGFVWSSRKWCEITFNIATEALAARDAGKVSVLDIALDMDVFKAQPDFEGQNALLYVNGLRLGSRFIKDRVIVMLHVPIHFVYSTGNVITIDTPDAAAPINHGIADSRSLGVQLFSVRTTVT